MSIQKTPMELTEHKDKAMRGLDNYLSDLIASSDTQTQSKADKLSYWLEDYVKFLKFEPQFRSTSYKKYKRGDVIKVHLGYNIGSEEGGLHYAIVLENSNSVYSPTVTILPLTSVKPHTNTDSLGRGRLHIGNEIFTSLRAKINAQRQNSSAELKELTAITQSKSKITEDIQKTIRLRIDQINSQVNQIKKEQFEIEKMKSGSIALINQITTISKIRIYDPKTNTGVLSGIKLSTITLDLINNAIADWMIHLGVDNCASSNPESDPSTENTNNNNFV